jgi:hypothetical protein
VSVVNVSLPASQDGRYRPDVPEAAPPHTRSIRGLLVSPRMEGRSVVEMHGQPLPLRVRRGFTLMESLIASAILFAGVLAVISAIMAGQRKAFEAEQQVIATLAAEELMGEFVHHDYADLSSLPPYLPAGDMIALVIAAESEQDLPGLDVRVVGITVTIQIARNLADLRPLVELSHFVPAPQL